MKLWIDDVRRAPVGHHWVKTYAEALRIVTDDILGLSPLGAPITEIAFDHDLGQDENMNAVTTIPIAKYLEASAYYRRGRQYKWSVHSMNPVGRRHLIIILQNADRFWSEPPRHLGSLPDAD